MTEQPKTMAYWRGWGAYETGGGNPFKQGTREHKEWKQGNKAAAQADFDPEEAAG